MNIQFEMRRFSLSRTRIMGYAMILVVIFHSASDITWFTALKSICDIGVDMFLLVSGIGIWFSLHKHSGIKEYLKGRITRIVPAFLIINTIWFIGFDLVLYYNGVITFLKDVTTLSFWLNGNLTTWYLSTLLVMQFLAPLIVKRENNRIPILTIVFSVMLLMIIRFSPLNEIFGHLLIWIGRIPVFVIGLIFGKAVHDNKIVHVNILAVLGITAVSLGIALVAVGATNFYLPYALKYLAYCPLSIIFSGLSTFIPSNGVAEYFGSYSLEIYLLHEKILWFVDNVTRVIIPSIYFTKYSKIAIDIIAIALALIGAFILKTICKKVVGLVKNEKHLSLRPRRER